MSSVKRYEVNGSSSFYEDEKGTFVDYEDYAALEAKCAALAAENAGLKAAAKETLAHWAAAEPGEMEPMMDKCMPSLRVAYCETPATDAFLAEVRARGGAKALEDFAEFNIKSIDPLDDEYTAVLKETARAARGFAAKLRREAAQ